MKRHVHAPQRTVTVEDGTVRDLDGNLPVGRIRYPWTHDCTRDCDLAPDLAAARTPPPTEETGRG